MRERVCVPSRVALCIYLSLCVHACRLTHRLRVLVSLVEVAMGDVFVSAYY